MIEPHSEQPGASSWILNATFVEPSDSVTVLGAALPFPFPFDARPFACPFVATTAREDAVAGEGEELTRAAPDASTSSGAASLPLTGESTATAEALGSSPAVLVASSVRGRSDPPSGS